MGSNQTDLGHQGPATGRLDGILNINKPAGLTSHDVVARVRRMAGQRKVGHAGTLDPMATGVLLLCLGQATRLVEYLVRGRKVYRAVVHMGIATDTYDAEGQVTQCVSPKGVSRDDVERFLEQNQGVIEQVPPPYSAIKHGGKRLYHLARQGVPVQAAPRKVEIFSIQLVEWRPPHVTMEVSCSPGTYIRSLAHDLGQNLGVGGHLSQLVRLASGDWRIESSLSLDQLEAKTVVGNWRELLQPMDRAVLDFDRIDLSDVLAQRVAQGQTIELDYLPGTQLVRAYGPEGRLLALLRPASEPGADIEPDRRWRPEKVFKC